LISARVKDKISIFGDVSIFEIYFKVFFSMAAIRHFEFAKV